MPTGDVMKNSLHERGFIQANERTQAGSRFHNIWDDFWRYVLYMLSTIPTT